MLTGRLIDAEEARRIGLVGRVVPDGEVVEAAMGIAREIAANSPMGVWMTKEVMSQLRGRRLQAGTTSRTARRSSRRSTATWSRP